MGRHDFFYLLSMNLYLSHDLYYVFNMLTRVNLCYFLRLFFILFFFQFHFSTLGWFEIELRSFFLIFFVWSHPNPMN
jgi:hypothetical protein